MGFEPTTPTLARLCSTPELRPRSEPRFLGWSGVERKGVFFGIVGWVHALACVVVGDRVHGG